MKKILTLSLFLISNYFFSQESVCDCVEVGIRTMQSIERGASEGTLQKRFKKQNQKCDKLSQKLGADFEKKMSSCDNFPQLLQLMAEVKKTRYLDLEKEKKSPVEEVSTEKEVPAKETKIRPSPPPPPPPPPIEIEVVEDDIEIEEELVFEESDTDLDEIEIEEEEEVDEFFSFAVVENPPIFYNCDKNNSRDEKIMCFQDGVIDHIIKNFEYPSISKEMGIQETIYVQFDIDKEGNITNIIVLRGEDKHLKQEAIRLIESLPKLIPATQRGKPVATSFITPIRFLLQ